MDRPDPDWVWGRGLFLGPRRVRHGPFMTAPLSVSSGPGNGTRGTRRGLGLARALAIVAALAAGACRTQEPDSLHEGRKPNRLVHEKSPYLLQHADNPVDWR